MGSWTLPALVVAAATLTAVATPLVARLAVRWGFVDRPAPHKYHAETKPLLGGLALSLGALLPLAALFLVAPDGRLVHFAAAAAWLLVVGLRDDYRRVSVAGKLGSQSLAALVLLAGGFRADLPLPGWATVAVTFLWIVGLINAFNLLDNIDGASAGVAAVAAAGALALADGSFLGAALAAATLGASLGFLPFNFHPSRLFMGDAGSLFLGLTLAVVGLELTVAGTPWPAVPLLFAVPLFDTAFVIVARLLHGKNPMTHPGTDHVAHRLARRGLGVRSAVVVLYLVGVLGGVLAWAAKRAILAS